MQVVQSRYHKIAAVLVLAVMISAALLWLFEERFDSDTWKSEPTKRYKMVDNLIESQLLMGKSKDDVIQLLGQQSSSISGDRDALVYKLGEQPSFFKSKQEHLLIIFINNLVNEVSLAYE